MRHSNWLIAVAVLVVVLAACGTDQSSSLPSSDDGSNQDASTPNGVNEPPSETPSGAPLACIIFEEVEYTFEDVRTVTPGEPTVFIVEGVEVDVSNLELVGKIAESDTRCVDQVMDVYRSNEAVDADAVYSSTTEREIVNPEDGQILEIPAEWIRWRAIDK